MIDVRELGFTCINDITPYYNTFVAYWNKNKTKPETIIPTNVVIMVSDKTKQKQKQKQKQSKTREY